MSDVDSRYGQLIAGILERGDTVTTRNSVCRRTFAEQVRFDSFPLVSVRATAWRLALREWEWFMSGSDAIEDLHPSVRHWWSPWSVEYPDGRHRVRFNYGHQMRHARGSDGGAGDRDQVELLVRGIEEHPHSRRNVLTTWSAADMAHLSCPITNCHGTVVQAFVDAADGLHLVTYQRSADVVCGLPHNWVQYWAFLVWLARRGGRKVGSLTWVGGDVHVYEDHLDLARRIVAASTCEVLLPVGLTYQPSGDDFRADDFSLEGEYVPLIRDRARMVV